MNGPGAGEDREERNATTEVPAALPVEGRDGREQKDYPAGAARGERILVAPRYSGDGSRPGEKCRVLRPKQ